MSDTMTLQVEMEVTEPQALALKAFFNYWNSLGALGGSRRVGFYVDGDGNFRPNCEVKVEGDLPELTDELRKAAVVEDDYGDRLYDYDPIAWLLRD